MKRYFTIYNLIFSILLIIADIFLTMEIKNFLLFLIIPFIVLVNLVNITVSQKKNNNFIQFLFPFVQFFGLILVVFLIGKFGVGFSESEKEILTGYFNFASFGNLFIPFTIVVILFLQSMYYTRYNKLNYVILALILITAIVFNYLDHKVISSLIVDAYLIFLIPQLIHAYLFDKKITKWFASSDEDLVKNKDVFFNYLQKEKDSKISQITTEEIDAIYLHSYIVFNDFDKASEFSKNITEWNSLGIRYLSIPYILVNLYNGNVERAKETLDLFKKKNKYQCGHKLKLVISEIDDLINKPEQLKNLNIKERLILINNLYTKRLYINKKDELLA